MRGWIIVGSKEPEDGVLPGDFMGVFDRLPQAANFLPGQWLEWRVASRMSVGVFCVCVEVPVA